MIALSFPRLGWTLLTPFALIPILWGTTGLSAIRAGLLGWLGGTVGYTVACGWVLAAVRTFQDVSAWQAVPFFVIAQVYHGGQFGLFASAATWLRGGDVRAPVLATSASWGLLEWFYPKLARWSLGDVIIDWPLIPQLADVVGTTGLGFLLAATSVVLFNASFSGRTSERLQRISAVALFACYGGAALYGIVRVQDFAAPNPAAPVEVAVVQSPLPVGDPDPQRASARAWEAYGSRSRAADLSPVDLLVWPETIIREYLRHGSGYTSKLSRFAASHDVDFIVGALDLPPSGKGEFSATYAFTSEHGVQRAHKKRLLPFGEYVPGGDWLPWLRRWHTTGVFLPGIEHPILLAAGARIGSSICFEAVFPGFNNDQLLQGANLLVNLSNDGWFGDSNLPYMHLQAARWRALEARRWLIRASNSGISAIISPAGDVTGSIPYGEAGVLRGTVFTETGLTAFVRWGSWGVWGELVLLFFGTLARLRYVNWSRVV